MTETFLPLYSPVYPCTPRILFTRIAFFKYVSAIYLDLIGSPGIKTVWANASFGALI